MDDRELLEMAAKAAGLRVICHASYPQGGVYVDDMEDDWNPITDDGDLRGRPWGTETRVLVERPDGRRALEFGRDLVEAPYRVQLQRPGASVTILANGLGTFEVLD
jgi:hypothetical protein